MGLGSPVGVRPSASCALLRDAPPGLGDLPWSSSARGSHAPWRDAVSWAGMSVWSSLPRLLGAGESGRPTDRSDELKVRALMWAGAQLAGEHASATARHLGRDYIRRSRNNV